MSPYETAFAEVGRKEDLHAQFWVIQESLHAIAIVFAIGHCIVRVARVRVSIVRSDLTTSIRRGVLGWGRTLLEQADIYTELE
jgi:hypothetical protein